MVGIWELGVQRQLEFDGVVRNKFIYMYISTTNAVMPLQPAPIPPTHTYTHTSSQGWGVDRVSRAQAF